MPLLRAFSMSRTLFALIKTPCNQVYEANKLVKRGYIRTPRQVQVRLAFNIIVDDGPLATCF